MTAYIVRRSAQKKKGILEKRESELLHQIRNQSSIEKLAKDAEKVRSAQRAVIKCLFHETEAVRPEDAKRFAKRWKQLERDRDYWENVSTAEIIDQYRKPIEPSDGKGMMQIRIATPKDATQVRDIHLSAFPEGESELVSKLAVDLLLEETIPPTFSLVAELDVVAVGHVAFSPVAIDSNKDFQGYILAPLAVRPNYQKQCIGSRLVESGIERLPEMSADALFVYGDPKYYGRFGFSADAAECYIPPYELQFPIGWQGLVLKENRAQAASARIACVPSLCDPALW